MLNSAVPAPPFSVVQGLRRAFWHWPIWGELSFFAFNLWGTPPSYNSLPGRVIYALALLLGWRYLNFVDDLGEARFPNYGRYKTGLLCVLGGALLIWLVSQFDWDLLANYRLDWRGVTGVLLMGTMMVLFVGSPLELWNRALKPFDKRAGASVLQRGGAALGFVAVCCAWWALLVGAIFTICSQPNLWR